MSPLWRDQLRVVLTPRQVVVLRLRAGVRRRVSSQHVIDCDPAQAGEASWHNALAVLQTALTEMGKNKADVFVMLSNHFVRYALIPHSNDMVTEEEQDALVRHSFTRLYGEGAGQWQFRLNHHADRNGIRLSCAVDRELPESLRALVQSCGFRLRSIQPLFTAAFNQWRHRLRDSVWFVVVERGRLCFAELRHKRWHTIKSINISDDWLRDLAELLHRETFLMNADEPQAVKMPVFIYAPGYADLKTPHINGHSVELLPSIRRRGATQANATAYAMAMVG